jgi:hypothetical protein
MTRSFIICILQPNNTTLIKSRKTGWAGPVEQIKEMRNSYTLLVGKTGEKSPFASCTATFYINSQSSMFDILVYYQQLTFDYTSLVFQKR